MWKQLSLCFMYFSVFVILCIVQFVLSLTVVIQYDEFHRCPFHNCSFICGQSIKSHLAVVPLIIFYHSRYIKLWCAIQQYMHKQELFFILFSLLMTKVTRMRKNCTPDGTLTHDLNIRSILLYTTELPERRLITLTFQSLIRFFKTFHETFLPLFNIFIIRRFRCFLLNKFSINKF